ncbi:MAG TPA: hypothetical protein VIW94_02360 [Acidimicrobiia bacterium]
MRVIVNMLGSTPFIYGAIAGLVGLALAYAFKKRGSDWGLWWALAAIPVTARYGSLRLGPAERVFDDALWAIPVAVAAVAMAAFGLWRLRDEWIGGPAFLLTVGAIWTTVPDTEHLAVLLGVTATVIWAWWPGFWSRPAVIGSIAVGMLVAWGVLVGSVTRDSGILGGLGALASLGWFAFFVPIKNKYVWLGSYAVVVLIWARWAGLSTTGSRALLIGAIAWAVAAVAARAIDRRLQNEVQTPPSAG